MSDRAAIRKCGCGIVAAADCIIYLKFGRSGRPEKLNIPLESYNSFLKYLNNRYFPLIPNLGLNAVQLIVGMNLYFAVRSLPYRASWLMSGDKLFYRIKEQLNRDIPVILSVGPNFPMFWQKNGLNFYLKNGDKYSPVCNVKAHYVTVTGISDKYFKISSWGRELYISKTEFKQYVNKYSASPLCNMVRIREI